MSSLRSGIRYITIYSPSLPQARHILGLIILIAWKDPRLTCAIEGTVARQTYFRSPYSLFINPLKHALLLVHAERLKHEKQRYGEGEQPTLLPFALCPRGLTTNFLPRG